VNRLQRLRAAIRRHPRLAFALSLLDAAIGALVTGAVSLWLLGFAWWSVAIAAASAVAIYFLSLMPKPSREGSDA
jgi:hypothetical protein